MPCHVPSCPILPHLAPFCPVLPISLHLVPSRPISSHFQKFVCIQQVLLDAAMNSLSRIIQDIRGGIPSSYHSDLENRLALAWGERQFNRSRTKLPKAQYKRTYRNNRARMIYLKVQDTAALLLLPFVLKHSPRACADVKSLEGLQDYARDYERNQIGNETVKLIEGMAMERGFNNNAHYLKFMEMLYEGL
jgi:hypothetical protein